VTPGSRRRLSTGVTGVGAGVAAAAAGVAGITTAVSDETTNATDTTAARRHGEGTRRATPARIGADPISKGAGVNEPAKAGEGAAGYSGTSLPAKLGIRQGSSVVLVGAPDDFEVVLEPLPPTVQIARRPPSAGHRVDVAVLFCRSQAELHGRFAEVAAVLKPAGGLWVAWPKRASGTPTDLTESTVRAAGLAHGLVDNKVCAITEVWSGLRFVVRLKDRPP
jgi:hypothetical protein